MRWWQELFVFPPRFARNCSIIKDMLSEKGDFDDDCHVGVNIKSYSTKIQFQHFSITIFFLTVPPYMPNGRKTISNFAQRPGDLILQLFSIFCQESIITDYHQLPG